MDMRTKKSAGCRRPEIRRIRSAVLGWPEALPYYVRELRQAQAIQEQRFFVRDREV